MQNDMNQINDNVHVGNERNTLYSARIIKHANDFAMSLLTVDYQATDAPEKFAYSLKTSGFVILKNHPLDWDKIEQIYAEWQAFFESTAKYQYPGDRKNQDGYFGTDISEVAKGHTVKDIKEYFSLFFPSGRYPKEISHQTQRYYHEASVLAQQLLAWLDQSLPADLRQQLANPLQELMCFERICHRIIYYPALTGDEEVGAERERLACD